MEQEDENLLTGLVGILVVLSGLFMLYAGIQSPDQKLFLVSGLVVLISGMYQASKLRNSNIISRLR